jgi:pimeloyl-ACP methyl ester carboxylesterase
MRKLITCLLYLAMAVSSTSCAVKWLPDERSGLGKMSPDDFNRFGGVTPTRNIFERTLSVPINPNESSSKYFDLYYFARMPWPKAAKTVLYIPGGPGQFIPGPISFPTVADFLIENGYNVIFYHARGVGFSQIPPRNKYDRFLKTSYVLDDIEAIRKDFLGTNGRWTAVIGYSFGTDVAQQYAGTFPDSLERLILIGVQSRHGFQNLPVPFDQIVDEIRDINRSTLERIYQRTEFSNLTPQQKSSVIDTALGTNATKGIFQRAEDEFGSLGYVISAYCELKAANELARYTLEYSQQFFKALRGLRDVGWFPPLSSQVFYGKSISDEILGTASGATDCGPDLTGSSDRVLNVVSIYDGINMRFLKKWLENGKTNLRDAVKASGGNAHYARGINKYINKIGVTNSETIENLDPARHRHDKLTLVLKGGADTVPVGGAAEHIFLNALTGSRTLIVYPGVGHFYTLPLIPPGSQTTIPGNSNVCVPRDPNEPQNPKSLVRDCLIYSFLEMNSGAFNDPAVNKLLTVIMNDNASICYRDQSMAQTRTVAGICP